MNLVRQLQTHYTRVYDFNPDVTLGNSFNLAKTGANTSNASSINVAPTSSTGFSTYASGGWLRMITSALDATAVVEADGFGKDLQAVIDENPIFYFRLTTPSLLTNFDFEFGVQTSYDTTTTQNITAITTAGVPTLAAGTGAIDGVALVYSSAFDSKNPVLINYNYNTGATGLRVTNSSGKYWMPSPSKLLELYFKPRVDYALAEIWENDILVGKFGLDVGQTSFANSFSALFPWLQIRSSSAARTVCVDTIAVCAERNAR